MSSPRRVAEGLAPVAIVGLDAPTPRRGIARLTLKERVLPSSVALVATATIGVLMLTSTAGFTPAAADGDAPLTPTTTVSSPAEIEALTLGARSLIATMSESDDVELAAARRVMLTKAAAEKAAAEKAAAEKAAAPKAASGKAAAQKAATPKIAPEKVTGNFAPASKYGLRGGAVKTYGVVMSQFSGINEVGGYRPSSLSNHQLGLAIDFMLTPGTESALGWSIAKYLAANASQLNIDHVIFEQHIWTPSSPTWRLMEDRGGITANHYDHVHVSMKS